MQADETYEAGYLADIIAPYAIGSFSVFSHRTNINTEARFITYNTKSLGSGIKDLGLYICLDDVLNRMKENCKKGIWTYLYIDEFHILLESPSTTKFLKQIWKIVRKWMGVPTGIMQNTEDLLGSKDARAIVNTTFFVIMMSSLLMDRQNLAEMFNLSNAQLEYITAAEQGSGLIYNGKVTVPFKLDFPENTKLYSIMNTKKKKSA